jgi:MFS transporter, PAT family, beta-lactamase induction signal transducer AmpG
LKPARKIAFLSSLYFVQGLPFGFQANALPNYLRASGVSLTGIGLASALALPWALKAFWAPAVDRHGSQTFGRRKSWIVPMQAAMALSCTVAAWLPPSAALSPLLVLILLLNLFAATQDIAVDGLAVELLGEKELGLGNAAQVVGYKLGMLTGGGLLVAASRFVGWQGLFLAMAGLCLAVMFVTYRFRESSEVVREHQDGPKLREVLARMLASLKLPGAGWLLIFIATYKLGEVMAEKMFGPFLIDSGIEEWRVGWWIGTWGMVASLLGSVAGGVLAMRVRLMTAIGIAALLRTLPLIAQWMLVSGWFPVDATSVIPITCLEHFFGGMLTTAMFALMMSKVDRRIGATHYTVLASVEVIGKSITGLSSGWIADRTSYATVNLLGVVVSFAFLLLLIPIRATSASAPGIPRA